MSALLVTAYVPIPGHPRGPEVYGALGERLSAVPVPKKAYYDQLPNLWLSKHIAANRLIVAPSTGDNPAKNTIAYHAVNHEKAQWLTQAMNDRPEFDVYVWVDYGIFSQPGHSNEAIYNFFDRVDDKAIYAPGCWDKPEIVRSVDPCWRFCGSVLSVPKKYVLQFAHAVREVARRHIELTHTVEFEVNTWARIEQARNYKFPIRWYRADHNETQFTNFPGDEQ